MAAFSSLLVNDVAIVADPGAAGTLPTTGGRVTFTAVGARTLPNPVRAGTTLLLDYNITDGGTVTVTASAAVNEFGSTVLIFTSNTHYCLFVSANIGANIRWRAVSFSEAIFWRAQPASGTALDPGSFGYNLTINTQTHDLPIPLGLGAKMTLSVSVDTAGTTVITQTGGATNQFQTGGANPGVITFANVREIVKLEAVEIATAGVYQWREVWSEFGAGGSIT